MGMVQYKLRERFFDGVVLHEPGAIISVPDDTAPGKTWIPYGAGPHRKWEPPVPPAITDVEREAAAFIAKGMGPGGTDASPAEVARRLAHQRRDERRRLGFKD